MKKMKKLFQALIKGYIKIQSSTHYKNEIKGSTKIRMKAKGTS